jgi:YggT family protein
VGIVAQLLSLVVWLFLVTLVVRFVLDLVQSFARDWRPRGVVLVLAEVVYSITDPPLRALRRLIPPLALGAVRLDMAFLVLWLICIVLMRVLVLLPF